MNTLLASSNLQVLVKTAECYIIHKVCKAVFNPPFWYSLTAVQNVPDSIPGYNLEIFLEVQDLERGPPSLVRPIGQLLYMRSSEIRLRKLKSRLKYKRFANHKAPILPFGRNHFSQSWLFGAVVPRIYLLLFFKIV